MSFLHPLPHATDSQAPSIAAKPEKEDYGLEDLKNNIVTLYMNRDDADVVLLAGDVAIRVHSFILCPRSKFFEAAINGQFKEGVTKRVELPEDNPILVSRLIQCCYTTDYDDGAYTLDTTSNRKFNFVSRLQLNADMYGMCDRFAMHGIKKVAVEKFKALLHSPLSSTLNVKHDRILDVIPIVYNSTPESDRGLRDPLTAYLAEQWNVFTKLPRFKAAVADTADLGFDLFVAKCKERCKGCDKRDKQIEKDKQIAHCNLVREGNLLRERRIFG